MIVAALGLWLGSAQAAPGAYTARTVRVELAATDDAEALPLRVSWPDGATGAPVIVWSHGMGGSRDAYEVLTREWVEAGYVVIQPTHGDSVVTKTKAELLKYGSPEAYARDRANTGTWRQRPAQISRVLDGLDAIVAAVDGLEPSHLDPERIGVGGHSFGAHTAMMIGGAPLGVPGLGAVAMKDDRVDALLLISPQGTGLALQASAYAQITPPTLMITGSEDRSARTGRGAEWRMEVWEGLPADHAWLLYIEGAEHNFGGISGRPGAEKKAAHVTWVQQTTGRFWDAQLRGDPDAAAWMDSGGIDASAGDKARLERKVAPPAPTGG